MFIIHLLHINSFSLYEFRLSLSLAFLMIREPEMIHLPDYIRSVSPVVSVFQHKPAGRFCLAGSHFAYSSPVNVT